MSHEEQERCGRDYCREHGFVVGMVHHETFTGFRYRERKKLSLMRDRYRDGKIQGVVVRTFDRLSRRQAHAAILMEEMDYHGVQFHCVMEPVNTEDKAMEQFVRMILAFVAEMEREKIMDRTMSGRVAQAKKGEIREGPKPLYGYRWHDPLTKDYRIIDETQAAVCRWLHEQFDRGI